MNNSNTDSNRPKIKFVKSNNNKSKKNGPSNTFRSIFSTLLLLVLSLAFWNYVTGNGENAHKDVPLSEVIAEANQENGKIQEINVSGNNLTITYKDQKAKKYSRKDGAGTLYDQGLTVKCADKSGNDATECLKKYPNITYSDNIDLLGIILNIASLLIPIAIAIFLFSRMLGQAQSVNKESMSFGKSRAKLYGPDKKRVLFTDVAGNEAAKQDLSEIVDFLKNPKKY